MITANSPLVQQAKVVQMFAPGTPGNVTHDLVSMKGYERATIIISVDNGATVTGAAVALVQAKNVANSPDEDKALALTKVWANIDTGASDALTETAVSNNTFTTNATNAKNLVYVVEVKAEELDVDNGFDVIGVATSGTAANMVADVICILWPARYGKATPQSAIID